MFTTNTKNLEDIFKDSLVSLSAEFNYHTFKAENYFDYYITDFVKSNVNAVVNIGKFFHPKNKKNIKELLKDRIAPLSVMTPVGIFSAIHYAENYATASEFIPFVKESISLKFLPLKIGAFALVNLCFLIDSYTTKTASKTLSEINYLIPKIGKKYTLIETNPTFNEENKNLNKMVNFEKSSVFSNLLINTLCLTFPPTSILYAAGLPIIVYSNNKNYREVKNALRGLYKNFKEMDAGIKVENPTLELLLGKEDTKFPLVTDSMKYIKADMKKNLTEKIRKINPKYNMPLVIVRRILPTKIKREPLAIIRNPKTNEIIAQMYRTNTTRKKVI